jgi:hypothetical protein
MTREEIARASRQDRAATIESPSAAATSQPASASAAATEDAVRARTGRPVLPAGVHEAFIPSGPAAGGTYVPALYGAARIHYRDARRGVDHTAAIQALAPFREARVPVDWESAEPIDVPAESLLPSPGAADPASMSWGALPSPALRPKSYETWARAFAQWVQRSQPLRLMRAPALGLTSQPGESERDFRIRLQQAAHEARDAAAEKLRARYATRVQRVAARVRSAEEAVAREQQQAQQQKVQSAVSIGAAMLGALMGRRAVSISSLGRATTAARGVGRSMKEAQDVARATDRLAEAKSELAKIQQDLEAEIAALPVGGDIAIEPVEIAPSRGGVEVRLVTLVWKRMELA